MSFAARLAARGSQKTSNTLTSVTASKHVIWQVTNNLNAHIFIYTHNYIIHTCTYTWLFSKHAYVWGFQNSFACHHKFSFQFLVFFFFFCLILLGFTKVFLVLKTWNWLGMKWNVAYKLLWHTQFACNT